MFSTILKFLVASACLVVLLAITGFQRRVDIGVGVVTPPAAGKIVIGRNTPPVAFNPETVTPSFFDYVRYALNGGSHQMASMADEDERSIDVDRRNMMVIQSRGGGGGVNSGVDPSRVRSADSVRAMVNGRNALRRRTLRSNTQHNSGSTFPAGGSIGN